MRVVVEFRKRGSALLGARAPRPHWARSAKTSFHKILLGLWEASSGTRAGEGARAPSSK